MTDLPALGSHESPHPTEPARMVDGPSSVDTPVLVRGDQLDKPTDTRAVDEINRLWQHGMHEERLFHDRLNYFSAIQVGLLGVFAILYHKEPSPWVFAPLTTVALAFALLWLRVQVRHWRYCVHVNDRIKRAVPEYARTIAAFASPGRPDGLSISQPLAFAVPLLFAATWLALFAWVLVRAWG